MMPATPLWVHATALSFAVALPIGARWARQHAGVRCAWDGNQIDAAFQVRIVSTPDSERRFCCIRCADDWLKERPKTAMEAYVRDEISGAELPVERALFVRSSVVTNPTTDNRIHVFRDRQSAERHAATASGILLSGEERPLSIR
jgi:hypothetical protein